MVNSVKSLFCAGLMVVLPRMSQHRNDELNPWQHTREGDGITVYTRGGESSGFKEIKATVTLECSLQTLVGALTDYGNYKNWIYSTTDSYTITKVSDLENTVYQYIDAPWPLSDRDVCMRIKVTQDPKSLTVTIDSKSENTLKEYIGGVVRDHTITPIGILFLSLKINCPVPTFLKPILGGQFLLGLPICLLPMGPMKVS